MKKNYNRIFIFLLLFTIIFATPVKASKQSKKTILILLDELDFEGIEDIVEGECGVGILNIKKRGLEKEEGLLLSLNAGRRLEVKDYEFSSLDNKRIYNYEELKETINKKNKNLKLELLGDFFKTGIIGDEKNALSIMDSSGNINYNKKISYDDNLFKDTKEALNEVDLLTIGFDIENSDSRKELLKEYIKEYKNANVFIISKKVSKENNNIVNRNLSPVIYINGEEGILKSNSTNRDGFITIEDISSEVLDNNNLTRSKDIGNKIYTLKESNPILALNKIKGETLNLMYIAYVLHTISYAAQGYLAYLFLKKKNIKKAIPFYKFSIMNIFVGFAMASLNLHRYLLIYLVLNLGITYFLAKNFKKDKNYIGIISTFTYILIIISILLKDKIIYNSFIGFNNLFYGARYYGFNNGIMGVLLVTSILTYFYLTENLKDNIRLKELFAILIFGLNMVVLSAQYGANTGGFISAVVLFLFIIYMRLLDRKFNFKTLIILIFIGILIFGVNMYLDSQSPVKSHAISFLMRIKEDGLAEFSNMLIIKIKELIKFTVLPPFSIGLTFELIVLYFINKRYENLIDKKMKLIFMTSIVAYLINDTGAITFIYMNNYLIAYFLLRLKYLEDGD